MTQQQFDEDVTRDIRALVARASDLSYVESAADYYDHTLFSKEADALFEHRACIDESEVWQ